MCIICFSGLITFLLCPCAIFATKIKNLTFPSYIFPRKNLLLSRLAGKSVCAQKKISQRANSNARVCPPLPWCVCCFTLLAVGVFLLRERHEPRLLFMKLLAESIADGRAPLFMAPFSAAAFDIWRREQTNIRGDRPALANDPPPHALDQHTFLFGAFCAALTISCCCCWQSMKFHNGNKRTHGRCGGQATQ